MKKGLQYPAALFIHPPQLLLKINVFVFHEKKGEPMSDKGFCSIVLSAITLVTIIFAIRFMPDLLDWTQWPACDNGTCTIQGWVSALSGWVAAVVALPTMWLLRKQVSIASSELHEVTMASKAQRRALVVLTAVHFDPKSENSGITTEISTSWSARGQHPAVGCNGFLLIKIVPRDDAPKEFPEFQKMFSSLSVKDGILAEGVPQGVGRIQLNAADFQQVKLGYAKIILYSAIIYADVDKAVHRTGHCQEYVWDGTKFREQTMYPFHNFYD